MDHGYAVDRSALPLQHELAGPAMRAASFVAGGGRAVVVSGPAECGKRVVVDGLLAGMAGRVLRVGGDTDGPLNLAGILSALGHVAADEADEQGLFFRTLAELAYDDYSAVLAIEGAHRLTGFALSALSRVPGLGGPAQPGMVLVLSGEPALLANLAAPGLEQLRNRRRTLLVKLPEGGAAERPAANMPTRLAAAALGSEPQRLGRDLRLVGLAAVFGSLLTTGVLALTRPHWAVTETQAVVSAVAEPVAAVPAGPAAAVPVAPAVVTEPDPAPAGAESAAPERPAEPGPAAVAPAAEMVPREVQLRRDFDAFLDRAGRDTAKLSPAARETLFTEYLQWRVHNGPERPGGRP